VAHHRRGLRRLLNDEPLADRIEQDWRAADLGERRDAMLEYAELLTRDPGQMTPAMVQSLQRAGFSDRDVLEICEVVAYYAYVNRIADGLGVSLEHED